MMRSEEEAFVDYEESSQCSSGCQSGWTLYLEHSGSGEQQCCTLPRHPADIRRQMLPHAEYSSDEEDSMVSDASSGPPHHLRDNEEELLQVRVPFNILSQQRPSAFGGDQCYDTGIGGGRRSGSVSGSLSLAFTRSRSLCEAKSRKKRRTVVQRADEAAMRFHGLVDDDDLHDTASSSAVVAPADVVEAMNGGGDIMDMQQPSCCSAFPPEHYPSLEWPAVRSTGMQGSAVLHHG